MSTRTTLKNRSTRYRVGAVAAVVVLPLALAACGSDDDPGSSGTTGNGGSSTGGETADALGSIKKGFDGLLDAKSASFELSIDDADGKLAAAITEDSPEDKDLADVFLGGKIRVVVDPAGDATLRSVSGVDTAKPLAEQLSAANLEIAVSADGGDIAGIRLVKGALYATVDLEKINALAKKGGSSGGILGGLDSFTKGAPPQASAAIKDVQAGKWLKLDLVPLAGQFEGLLKSLPKASASAAAVQGQKLVDDVINAILPATTATGEDGDYTVEIKAKQALTALAGVLKTSGIPGADMFDTSDLSELGEGTVKGKVKVDGDSLKEVTIDLQSVNELFPATDQAKGGLQGSSVKLTFDDEADEVTVPDDVSGVDLNALLQGFIGQFAGAFGGTPS